MRISDWSSDVCSSDLLHDWFLAEPWRTGRELLDKLQAVHPGEHPDALLRTVQRRLKIWRAEQAHQLVFGPMALTPSVSMASLRWRGDGRLPFGHNTGLASATPRPPRPTMLLDNLT